MATLQQLETALINADKAGDMQAARQLAAVISRARQDSTNQIPDTQVNETLTQANEPSLGDRLVGAGEAGLTAVTGMTGGALGMAGGAVKGIAQSILDGTYGTQQASDLVEQEAMKGSAALTYQPRTEEGQRQAEILGEGMQQLVPIMPMVGELGAIGAGIKTAQPAIRAVTNPMISGAQRAAAATGSTAMKTVQAVKNAPARAAEMVGIKQPTEIASQGSAGAAATPLELQRATQAEQAGLRLSEGEIKRNPQLLASERELAKTPEYQQPFLERQQENNAKAAGNFESWIDETSAQNIDPSNTGVKVIDTLMKGWKEEKAKTNAKYNAFKESPEAATVADATPITEFLNSQPKGVSGVTGVTDTASQNAVRLGIAEVSEDGSLIANPNATVGKLEEFRSSVNAIGAQSANDKRLASILKKHVDDIGEPIAGPMMKDMRLQRQNQARKYENRAIVSKLLNNKRGTDDAQVPIEEVFNKTILSARPSEIQHIKRVLLTIGDTEGREAWNDLRGATIAHIRESAESGIGADNMPVISAAKMDKALKALDKNGKLNLVLGNKLADQVRNMNDVLQYIQTNPPMTSINNSGTARTIMAMLAESGITGATTGIPLPVITGLKLIRSHVKDNQIKAKITKALNYKPTGTF